MFHILYSWFDWIIKKLKNLEKTKNRSLSSKCFCLLNNNLLLVILIDFLYIKFINNLFLG